MGNRFPDQSTVRKVPVLPHEKVLRLFITQQEAGYKDGWLYYQCKEKDLLAEFNEYRARGVFDLLKSKVTKEQHTTKLTIELVPKTCWFSNVRSNVSGSQWTKLKKITSQKANYCCEICGGKGPKWPVECHEVWEYDEESLTQRLKRLIALCPDCHSVKHMGYTQLCGRDVEITCHLAIVNQWSYAHACDYVSQQFEVWAERSKYSWLLDISWLDQFNIAIKNQERIDNLYPALNQSKRSYYLKHRKKSYDYFIKARRLESAGDYLQASHDYLLASKLGCIDSTFNLAIFYAQGRLGAINIRKSWYFFKKAACFGDEESIATVKQGWDQFKASLMEKDNDKTIKTPQIPSAESQQHEKFTASSELIPKENTHPQLITSSKNEHHIHNRPNKVTSLSPLESVNAFGQRWMSKVAIIKQWTMKKMKRNR